MARKFLYFVTFCIVVVIAAMVALNIWSKEATEFTFVPRGEFVEQDALAANAYEDPDMWYARPGLGNNPARYRPDVASAGEAAPTPDRPAAERSLLPTPSEPSPAPSPSPAATPDIAAPDGTGFALFFVHPTSYIPDAIAGGAQWNAALGNTEAEDRARLFIRGLASPFGEAREIWIPKYRQAHVGAFLTDQPQAQMAIDAAYRDVEMAFDLFAETVDADTPIVLAGHSQGALHILTLLREKVRGTDLEGRIAAVYPVGWPISVDRDLPQVGFPACATPDQPACLSAWVSFAEPADPRMVLQRYSMTQGYDGQVRGDSPILCVNPITGTVGGSAPASANTGTLVPDGSFSSATLQPQAVGARCDERGLLLITDPPDMGSAVLPGNNYHVYDIPLFWQDLRSDVERRVSAWLAAR